MVWRAHLPSLQVGKELAQRRRNSEIPLSFERFSAATSPGSPLNDGHMNESVSEIQRLLQEIADHTKSGTKTDTRKAVAKLERIAALASTLALTIQARR